MSSRHSSSDADDALQGWLPLVYEHAPDGVLLVDEGGRIFAANAEALRLTGYSREELVDAPVDMLVPTRLAPGHAAHRREYGRAPRTRYMGADRRLRLRRRDGSELHVDIGLSPVEHGAAHAIVCAIRDVSQVREVEEALRRRTIELERALTEIQQQSVELARLRDAALEAAEARSRFLSTVSHEIRTPLNGLTGVLDLLGDTVLTPTQRELMSMGKVSAEWLLALVNDVLDLSKLEANRVTLEELDFDLTALVDEVVRMLGVVASARGVCLTARVDPRLSFLLRGDSRRLRQVLINLVGNAIKFTADGDVTVAVVLHAETDDRADVELRVVDTGCGIDESTQSRLFTPYAQGPTSSAASGTGLGLSISRQLVELMGGTIDLSSQLGAGSTFTVRVPFGRSHEPGGTVQPVGESDTAAQSLPPGTRVLVAEDDPISRRVVSAMLEALGASVTPVSDGRDALDAFSTGAFDLVLMDGQMPSMDGWEAAKAIRAFEAQHGGRTPVIALTANVMKTDRERALAAGMDDMLSKPLQRAALVRMLHKWCGASARDKR